MRYAIQNIMTKKWLTNHGMKPWFTDNTAIRYESDNAKYLLDAVKQLPDSDKLIVLEV